MGELKGILNKKYKEDSDLPLLDSIFTNVHKRDKNLPPENSQKSCLLYRPDDLPIAQHFPLSSEIGIQRSQRRFHLAEPQGEEQFYSELSEQTRQWLESLGLSHSAGNTYE